MAWHNSGSWAQCPVAHLHYIMAEIETAIKERFSILDRPYEFDIATENLPATPKDEARLQPRALINLPLIRKAIEELLEPSPPRPSELWYPPRFARHDDYDTPATLSYILGLGSYGSSWIPLTGERAQNPDLWLQIKEALDNMIYVKWNLSGMAWDYFLGWDDWEDVPDFDDLVEGGTSPEYWRGSDDHPDHSVGVSIGHSLWSTWTEGTQSYHTISLKGYETYIDGTAKLNSSHPTIKGDLVKGIKVISVTSTPRYTGGITITLDGVTYTPGEDDGTYEIDMGSSWPDLDEDQVVTFSYSIPEDEPAPAHANAYGYLYSRTDNDTGVIGVLAGSVPAGTAFVYWTPPDGWKWKGMRRDMSCSTTWTPGAGEHGEDMDLMSIDGGEGDGPLGYDDDLPEVGYNVMYVNNYPWTASVLLKCGDYTDSRFTTDISSLLTYG